MKKPYTFAVILLITLSVNAQTTIDISQINSAYTKTIDNELVIDVATTSSAIASPLVSFTNPFKGGDFTEVEISFDVKNYGSLKVLGSLLAFYDATLGRMYFSNGSYLGYNANGFFDANLGANFTQGTDFLGLNAWKSVKLQFSNTGFSVYVDNVLKYNQASSTLVSGNLVDYTIPINFFKNASTFAIGTGSWWSDNFDANNNNTYYDAQSSYLKNIKFTPNFSITTAIEELELDTNLKITSEEYFSITGAKQGIDFRELAAGIYIKKIVYENGIVESSKIMKMYK